MTSRYIFPQSALVDRMVAKSKIYEQIKPSSKIKDLFVREVQKIVWAYKLSPTTINIPASRQVQEIQIFRILSKSPEISEVVLSTIDKAIPSPIIFQIEYDEKIKYAACYKRPSETDRKKRVLSSYFMSGWMEIESTSSALPVVLNMGEMYQSMLGNLCPLEKRANESIDDLIARFDLLNSKRREMTQLESRVRKEKQFNRQVELNQTLQKLKSEITKLQ